MRGPVVVVAGLALASGSGCGGTSEEEEARQVVREYAGAIADGDERRACATLSNESKKRIERGKTTCVDAYEGFGKFLREKQKEKLRNLDPQMRVDGDKATTRIDQPPLQGELRLNKEDGKWKVSIR
jgi:hypothetical protein